MTQPLFLLYGGKGWIGNQIAQYLQSQNIPFQLSNCRANNIEDVDQELATIKPTHVISTIGRTRGQYNNTYYNTIDYLEQPGKIYDNVRDNLFSPLVLAVLTNNHNIHYTYMGTGCIFNFDENHPLGNPNTGFSETDKPNFVGSSYSVVKGFSDQLIPLFRNTLNVRIRMPITNGIDKYDFISKILKYEKICDMPNSMSVLPTLIPIMIDMSLKKETGTINLTNPGLISHNQILEMYKNMVDPSFQWQNFTIQEQDELLCSKRSNNCLDTTKLVSMYPDVPDIMSDIEKIISKIEPK